MDEIPNPFRETSPQTRHSDPAVIVIFGASGDLTSRKLLPAIRNLFRQGLLEGGASIVGVARRALSDDDFREAFRKVAARTPGAEESPDAADAQGLEGFLRGLFYVSGSFEDPATYRALAEKLRTLDTARGTRGNRLFYLATPPSAFPVIVSSLDGARLVNRGHDGPWTRVIIEKPIGHDLDSALGLNKTVGAVFREDQIYRIDHYLGKETVQNILVLRLANGIFEPLWNNRYVDHIQITVAEALGVEGRAGYFEQAGIIRDIVQNHMLQLLSLTAMEPPGRFEATAVRNEKVKVLEAIHVPTLDEVARHVVRGQYGPGYIAGQKVPAYREETGVNSASATETYVAMRLKVDNWRWAGVPFYLRSGKRLPKRETEIAIVFKPAPHSIFRRTSVDTMEPNVLAIQIQPDEGISMSFGAKVPGPAIRVDPVRMDFRYSTSFGGDPPEAYERLILDALVGDSTLFARRDEVEAAWKIVDAIVDGWRASPPPQFPNYEAGTWNPPEAEALLAREGRRWRRL